MCCLQNHSSFMSACDLFESKKITSFIADVLTQNNKTNKKFWTAQPKAAQGKTWWSCILFLTTQEKT